MHNRKLNRLSGYDYSTDNLYFVTSPVRIRICCFGRVHSGKMILNEYGDIAMQQWYWLAKQYSFVVLHAFVHGIIEINSGTGRDLSQQHPIKIKSLSELMGAYKTTTSKKIHALGYNEFAWQRSFHDHIIRDNKAYQNISDYIINNPEKWEKDKLP